MRRSPLIAVVCVLLLPALAAATETSANVKCEGWHGQWQETKVFFGLSKANGNAVSRRTLDDFVRETIVPTFPDGFTLVETTGYWHDMTSDRTLYENGLQLVVLHEASPESDASIDAVARKYRMQFEQQSVLISKSNAQVRSCTK